MSEKRDEIFSIKQIVAIKTGNNKPVSASIYLSNIRLALNFKNGKTYSIPISNLHDISITKNQFIQIYFKKTISIPEISSQPVQNVIIAQIIKNSEGKCTITTSPAWVSNWVVSYANQAQSDVSIENQEILNEAKVDITKPA